MRAVRVLRMLARPVMFLSCLGGLAMGVTLLVAGYPVAGIVTLVAAVRVTARQLLPGIPSLSRGFPWVVLWVAFDAATLLGALVLGVGGAVIVTADILTLRWWAAVPGVLALIVAVSAFRLTLASITRALQRSRGRGLVKIG